MEGRPNFMEGLKIILDKRGWGGNSNSEIKTESEALGRLECIVGTGLVKEMSCVHSRNDSLLRAIHFQDRRLTSDFIEVAEYVSEEELRSQVKEAYHRNNILFDAYKQSISDSNHFPELPNDVYARERGWGGIPDVSIQDKESAERRLANLDEISCIEEMKNLDERNDELCRLIHEKETNIAAYLAQAKDSMNPQEIREQVKHAYYRNNLLFDLFGAVTSANTYLEGVFTKVLLERDAQKSSSD